jgi:hypothetical protein
MAEAEDYRELSRLLEHTTSSTIQSRPSVTL